MNIAEINMTDIGSTGKIMFSIADVATNDSDIIYTYSPYPFSKKYQKIKNNHKNHFYYGTWIERRINNVLGRIFGLNGLNCFWGTISLLHNLKSKHVNIIHLHNLHGYCIFLPLLFSFIKRNNIKVIWTLHDCWTFTGHCPYFTMINCDKWEYSCHHCPQYREYPQSLIDSSKIMWKLKRNWFSGVNNMIIITPSQWLAGLVKKSFLKDYPVKVINNGIDLSVFKPTVSDFRQINSIPNNKFIILGVAFGWGVRKGLDVFLELSKKLPTNRFQIVLVGTDDNTDKQLPTNIISIHRTQNQQELAEIYTAADLFVNPTREENYPTVNMESIACGTPVLTFRTGGSPEIPDEKSGAEVECDDVDALVSEVIRLCEISPFKKEDCIQRAKKFDINERFREYIELYRERSI